MAGKAPKYPEATWPVAHPELAVSEFTAENAGAQSPFGDDLIFPLPVEKLRYSHPTSVDKPNLAGS